MNRLEEVGALETAENGDVQLAGGLDPAEAAKAAADAHQRLKQAERERVELMRQYAELTTCRRAFLLRYFGEEFDGPCGNCDNDAEPGGPSDTSAGTRRDVA